MKRRDFLLLAKECGIEKAVPFSQRAWRRRHYAVNPGKLCSGLTHFWLGEMLCRRGPLRQLRAPNNDALERIRQLQFHSYYPSFPRGHLLSDVDRMLLKRKYGTCDWPAISRQIKEQSGGDSILYDIAELYDYDSAAVTTFEHFPGVLPDFSSPLPGSAALVVLRYRQSGVATGHRIAYYLSKSRHSYFFDPNAGAILESRESVFHKWLSAYHEASPYPVITSPKDGPALKLYLLNGASMSLTMKRSIVDRRHPQSAKNA